VISPDTEFLYRDAGLTIAAGKPKIPVPVARTIAWLLSDYAAAITGEIVHVDGGVHAVGA